MKLTDKLGIFLSFACVLHCILLPIILPLLPFIGFAFDHNGLFHVYLSIIIVAIACITLMPGYLKHHNPEPLGLAFIAACILILSGIIEMKIGHTLQITLATVAGSCSMIWAHYTNHKNLCACEHHKCEAKC